MTGPALVAAIVAAVVFGGSTAALTAVGTAGAARRAGITDCGWYQGTTASGRQIWRAKPQLGFAMHLTTRSVRCPFARRFVLTYRGTDQHFPTWRCREIQRYESMDLRCVSGTHVIRWVGGS